MFHPNNEDELEKTFLVLVGSSAGGIDALIAFVEHLPADLPAPVILAQHLSPTHVSKLTDILQQHSNLPIRTAQQTETLQKGTIYVIPPNCDAEIGETSLCLNVHEHTGPKPSIDRLFSTASTIYRDRLIAIILSGLGSDGQSGARYVKEAGGTIIIQEPSSAGFPSMPLAIPPTLVDITARPEALGKILQDLMQTTIASEESVDQKLLRVLLAQLRDRSGIDFTQYKSATIMRRLARLMVAGGINSLTEYLQYLQRNPEGYQRLVNSFLIKVTEFFRDAPLFEQLHEHTLPELIAQTRERSGELRIWSAGTSTGEEAYSLAILCAELLQEDGDSVTVRIFATDVDEEAIAFARRGIYSHEALRNVPEAWIRRYFTPIGDAFEVSKKIRNMTVFGQHDLGQRAPFPRIDLCVCRNALIYFTKELQTRALQLFAFALRTSGYLVLGKAETATPLQQYFRTVNPTLKIYQRIGERALLPPTRLKGSYMGASVPRSFSNPIHVTNELPVAQKPLEATRFPTHDIFGLLMNAPEIGLVAVDRRYDILAINTAARSMLQIHGVGIGEDLLHLATIAGNALRPLIDRTLRGESGEPVLLATKDPVAGIDRWLHILCYADSGSRSGQTEIAMLTIVDATHYETRICDLEQKNADQKQALANQTLRGEELSQRLKALLTANDELTSTNAELRTYNEQLLINTEEAASANEEIETLNEEMQATNEELETLNEELQAAVEELNTTNDELESRGSELERNNAARELKIQAGELERRALANTIEMLSSPVAIVDTAGTPVFISTRLGDAGSLLAANSQWWSIPTTLRLESGGYETTIRALEAGGTTLSLILFHKLDPLEQGGSTNAKSG